MAMYSGFDLEHIWSLKFFRTVPRSRASSGRSFGQWGGAVGGAAVFRRRHWLELRLGAVRAVFVLQNFGKEKVYSVSHGEYVPIGFLSLFSNMTKSVSFISEFHYGNQRRIISSILSTWYCSRLVSRAFFPLPPVHGELRSQSRADTTTRNEFVYSRVG